MKRLNIKKKFGFILLSVVVLCWIAVPILPFFEFSYKAILIPTILIVGEILFAITIVLLGKEYWNKIKNRLFQTFSYKKKYELSEQLETPAKIKSPKDKFEIE